MLADRNSTIINEPLLARHARHMHQFAQAVVRKTFMSGFDPHVATDILTAAHKRRSMDVTLMPRSELTREIAIEEMRREINVTFANRISKVLLLVLACVMFLVITLYGFLWDQSDHLKGVYLQARGMGSSQATRQAEQAPARELTPMQQKVKRLREQAREKLRQLKDLERQKQVFSAYRGNPAISEKALDGVIAQLDTHGIVHRVECNQGGKGRPVKQLVEEHGASVAVFVDDLPQHHESVARAAPQVHRLHMVSEPLMAAHVAPGTDCASPPRYQHGLSGTDGVAEPGPPHRRPLPEPRPGPAPLPGRR